ncbi:tyrosine-type recombinase/integrase [Paraburkholderia silvatlantica]|uniref:Integrase n=1 Tax=Paraburkholderia silvatlantica TaxID=321895 RepID=A0ABR6FZX5_9BURK|nr:site-specific integrase [Paraburkholderia silvatlantica]MBB2932295.1 integrase [Paraburkholderia silvatlantica]PVY23328.1 site-specific recombinase XerD [Paraburkholderia silvatlantica]PXW29887.1 site-specific recombinase XerD [Paraburkholderia silvatlantica]
MSSLPANASSLRQRMIDDMRLRQLAPKTQAIYLHIVSEFARFLGRSPDPATVEDLRRYQLYLADHGTSAVSLNHAITGLKFFFTVTLDGPELMVRMQPVRVPRVLPIVLSPDEVRRLIEAAANLKHQTALSVAYGAGLRASEVVALKATDVDSERMTLRIEQGKGRRDRYAMLSPVLLERLRAWWRAQGRLLDGGWLFPGLDPLDQLSTRQLNRAIHAAAERHDTTDEALLLSGRHPPTLARSGMNGRVRAHGISGSAFRDPPLRTGGWPPPGPHAGRRSVSRRAHRSSDAFGQWVPQVPSDPH